MQNPFPYAENNKRYHTLAYYHKQRFGCRVVKIPLNAGFTCPNIDGTRGRGGCTYCSPSGSGEFAGQPGQALEEQFRQGVERSRAKWPIAVYLPYFQAHTNTYAPVEILRQCYEPMLLLQDVVGLSIATRADCCPPEVLDYLEDLAARTYLTVELGLQSAFDDTGERINRCHTFAEFTETFHQLQKRGVRVCVHLIDGLPGEDEGRMLETVRRVAALRPDAVKLHLLHIIEGTALAEEWKMGRVPLLERDAYVDLIIRQLELLPPETVVERVTGDGPPDSLLGPLWSLDKRGVLNQIDREMTRRNTWQGRRWQP